MNDLIHYAMERAVAIFGDEGDNVFTSASLSDAITELAGTKGVLDGRVIRVLLIGRSDVEILDRCHFRLITEHRR